MEPVELFFSYSHVDQRFRERLDKHLSLLKREGLVSGWHDRMIRAGDEWAGEISEHLERARIILLLVSADFVASEYCYDNEMRRALERHEAGEARVIPVIMRPVDWASAPFGKLQALPRNAKPITTWSNRDEAFLDVALGIREVIQSLRIERTRAPASASAPASTEERKVVTILVVDVAVGLDLGDDTDPETVRVLLTPFLETVQGEIARFGGVIERTIGDAVIAVFGVPATHEDDPARGVNAAIAVRNALATSPAAEISSIRAAVHTGETLVSTGSGGAPLVFGDVVNTAINIQHAAPPGRVLVGEATWRHTRALFEFGDPKRVEVHGKQRPVTVREALGMRS